MGFCIPRSAWFDSGYMRCVSLRGSWKVFGVVQTVRKTVKVPHAFLDMAVDKCWMVETVQILWEFPQLVLPSSVSVDGRLSSGNCFSDVMDNEQFWRWRPCCVELLCRVSLGSVAQGFEP